jgi:uncharacterized protein YjiS (DUF1127 family)
MERVLVLRCEGGNWEIRFCREPWWERWLRAWRENRSARTLAELDERTLRDIGMDAEAFRRREQRRIDIARLGLM